MTKVRLDVQQFSGIISLTIMMGYEHEPYPTDHERAGYDCIWGNGEEVLEHGYCWGPCKARDLRYFLKTFQQIL